MVPDSALSIASEGSFLSIGSVGSFLSVASVGSSTSLLSAGSWLSIGSALSAQSIGSVLSWRSVGSVRSAAAVAGAAALGVPWRAALMAATVDEYLAGLPDDVRARVEEVRRVVHQVVPDAGETISYAMPTFTLDGQPLAARRGVEAAHRAVPAAAAGPGAGRRAWPRIAGRKDTMRLPYAEPLPRELVARVVEVLVERRRSDA